MFLFLFLSNIEKLILGISLLDCTIKPQWLNLPVRVYDNPNLQRNLIGSYNKKRSVIYQWTNLITGKRYIGSAWNAYTRLLSYFILVYYVEIILFILILTITENINFP